MSLNGNNAKFSGIFCSCLSAPLKQDPSYKDAVLGFRQLTKRELDMFRGYRYHLHLITSLITDVADIVLSVKVPYKTWSNIQLNWTFKLSQGRPTVYTFLSADV